MIWLLVVAIGGVLVLIGLEEESPKIRRIDGANLIQALKRRDQ